MRRTFLQSIIHRAPATRSILVCEGSVAFDEEIVNLASFAELKEPEARTSKPTMVLVDSQNRIVARNAVEVPGPARRVRA